MKALTTENGFTLIEAIIFLLVFVIVFTIAKPLNPFSDLMDLIKSPKIQKAKTITAPEPIYNRPSNTLPVSDHDLIHPPDQATQLSLIDETPEPEKEKKEQTNIGDICSKESDWPFEDETYVESSDDDFYHETEIENESKNNRTNHEKELYQTYLSIWDEMNKTSEGSVSDDTSSL